MKHWSEEAWTEASGIYAEIIGHPFINELANGSLSGERFKRYIAQDELYLGNYGRQMFKFADMIENPEQKEMFVQFAKNGLEGEKAMHELMIERFGIEVSAKPSPATYDYNAHTESAISTGCKEIAFASLLPCIWIYNEVGKYLLSIAKIDGNPYREWIEEYGNDDFSSAVIKVISLIDEYASQTDKLIRDEMKRQFCEGVRYELEFWEFAYNGSF